MWKKIILFALFFVNYTFSQAITTTENTKVSIITVGTANEAHTFYGHTALRFRDQTAGYDFVFNFGYFDFNTENFILKFVKGDLNYFVASNSYINFEEGYKAENRSIYEQELNLSVKQKQDLFTIINKTLYSNERFYTYKFIDRNCTTMVIDKINEVLGKKIIQFNQKQNSTYRSVLFPYTNSHFYQQLGINLIFGTKVDSTTTKLFLPLDLMQELEKLKLNNKPIASKTTTIFEAKPINTKSFLDSIFSLSIILLLIILINKKGLTIAYFIIQGLLGIFLCMVGFYSMHEEVLWNYNALLVNPLYLILSFFILKNNTKQSKYIISLLFISSIIYLIWMVNKAHFISILPILLANLILLKRLSRKLK